MHKKLILAAIALNGLALCSYAMSRPATWLANMPTALVSHSIYKSVDGAHKRVTAEYAATPIARARGFEQAVDVLSGLANFLFLEPAAGFLIGAILLGVGTSLRLKVMRKSNNSPGLQSQ